MLETDKKEYEKECEFQQHPYRQWWIERQTGWQTYIAKCEECELNQIALPTESNGPQTAQETVENPDVKVTESDWVIFVSQEGELQEYFPTILHKYLEENPKAQVFYADEDCLLSESEDGSFTEKDRSFSEAKDSPYTEKEFADPWFKPDWSPDTFRSFFYFGNIFGLRRAYAKPILARIFTDRTSTPPAAGKKGTVSSDIVRFSEKQRMALQEQMRKKVEECVNENGRDCILHIPEILLHSRANSVWEENITHCHYPVGKDTLVSVIIPSRDHPEMLERCISSIRADIPYELIVVDNGSKEENRKKLLQMQQEYGFCYIYEKADFNFSKMCNRGVEEAKGNVLLFLNDDITAIEKGWMEIMAGQALQRHTGAVGAKLYYPDSRIIQHAGITNMKVGPVHKMGGMNEWDDSGAQKNIYHMRNLADYNVIAVTAACLAVEKSKFEQVGGFPEELEISYNDVALGFALYEAGWYNVVRNDVTLYHHESISRGSDEAPEKEARRKREWKRLYERHPALYGKDPFYHKDLVQERLDADFHVEYQYPYENRNCFSEVQTIEAGKRRKKIKRFFEPGFATLPERIFRKMTHRPPDVQMCLDVVEWREAPELLTDTEQNGGAFLEIRGWAALTKIPMPGQKRTLILWDTADDRYLEASVFDWYREDAAAALPLQPFGKLAGFTARIAANEWICPDNWSQYEMGILFENAGKSMKWIRWNK